MHPHSDERVSRQRPCLICRCSVSLVCAPAAALSQCLMFPFSTASSSPQAIVATLGAILAERAWTYGAVRFGKDPTRRLAMVAK